MAAGVGQNLALKPGGTVMIGGHWQRTNARRFAQLQATTGSLQYHDG